MLLCGAAVDPTAAAEEMKVVVAAVSSFFRETREETWATLPWVSLAAARCSPIVVS